MKILHKQFSNDFDYLAIAIHFPTFKLLHNVEELDGGDTRGLIIEIPTTLILKRTLTYKIGVIKVMGFGITILRQNGY